MRGAAQRAFRHLTPNGWSDLVRQLLLFCGAYLLYRVVRGGIESRAVEAFDNAREVVALEQALGLFFEPSVHAWAEGRSWVIESTSWMYVNSHFVVTTCTLAFVYLRRNDSFYFIRNMFTIAMAIAIVGYALYPTAPPRFLPELGFGDPVATHTGVTAADSSADALYNPFAAIPSMHVGFALMLGVSMARIVRRGAVRAVWLLYPAVVAFTVVATANHWWFDAFLGAVTAAASAWAAHALLARARPHAWAWTVARAAPARVAS